MAEKYKTRFPELTRMKYAEQAKWFLNGFWVKFAKDQPEKIWEVAHKFIELDPKKKEGCELDEFWSHKFLESLGETLTAISLREKLRKIDLDMNGKMALLEYLAFKYNVTIIEIVDSPQGDNSKELAIAQDKLTAAQNSLDEVQKKIADVSKAAQELATKEAALEKQKQELTKAEDELKAAVEDLRAQEQSYKQKIADLEKKSADTGLSQVQRSKAAAELAQTKQEDPMPLRKAKITQEAALRRVEKERKAVETAKENAKTAREALEKQRAELETVENECRQKLQEAEEFLEDVKKKGGNAEGAIWWLSRELTEQKKYMPKSKGGIDKK